MHLVLAEFFRARGGKGFTAVAPPEVRNSMLIALISSLVEPTAARLLGK